MSPLIASAPKPREPDAVGVPLHPQHHQREISRGDRHDDGEEPGSDAGARRSSGQLRRGHHPRGSNHGSDADGNLSER